jgi:hypothetical protein
MSMIGCDRQTGSRQQLTSAPTPAGIRMLDGHPDLSGPWRFETLTPLERPDKYQGREFLTDAEVAELEGRGKARQQGSVFSAPSDSTAEISGKGTGFGGFVDNGVAPVVATKRTSLVIDPPDGRVPALTPEAVKQEWARIEGVARTWGPEDRDLSERCLVGFNAGPPIIPHAYNNNMHLFQTPDRVAILTEMMHNTRIIPIDKRPHLPDSVRQWGGDSIGKWEGDTLVVDTTNFSPKYHGAPIGAHRGYAGKLHLTEKLKLLDADTLLYEFTINSPEVYTRPWTAQFTMKKSEDRHMYEYSCHETNYGMFGALAGHRADEKNGVKTMPPCEAVNGGSPVCGASLSYGGPGAGTESASPAARAPRK